MPQHKLDDALEQLVNAELIFRRGTPPDAEYMFRHALVQDAAYSTLLRSRRQPIHACIASTLEEKFPEIVTAQPALLAQHCAQAGLNEKAVRYWLNAAQRAIGRCAMSEATALLRNGLDLLPSLPDGQVRHEQELDLQITLGQALLATKGYGAAEPGEAFARARLLCDALDRPPQLGSVLRGQFVFHLARGELEQAEHHAEEIRQLGDVRDDVMWKCFGSMFSGNICCWLAKFNDARAYYENGLSLWEPRYRAFAATPEDPYVGGLSHLSRTLLCLGYVDQARSRRDEALAEARQLSPYNLVFALVHAWCGINWAIAGPKSAEAILQSADELLAICTEQGFPEWVPVGTIMRGWCLGALGKAAEGIPLILQGIAITRPAGAHLLASFALATLAQTYERAGQPQEGLNHLAEAVKLVESTHERWAEAEMHRMRGRLLLLLQKHAAAERSFAQGLAVARGQSAKFWELRAAVDLGRLWCDQSASKPVIFSRPSITRSPRVSTRST